MDIEKLSLNEKIELVEQILRTIKVPSVDLDDAIIINKKILGAKIAQETVLCGKIDLSDLDEAIWAFTFELEGEIRGYVYDYAHDNKIRIKE